MAKMGPKMIALCAAAVGIIYTTGYIVTEPAVVSLAQTAPAAVSVAQSVPSSSTGSSSAGSSSAGSSSAGSSSAGSSSAGSSSAGSSSAGSSSAGSSSAGSSSTGSSSVSPSSAGSAAANSAGNNASNGTAGSSGAATSGKTSQYRDGTYYGQGSNRIGSVAVAVTISQGKISACEITSCNTHYSESAINPMLPQAVVQLQSANVDAVSGATRSSEDFAAAVQQALAQAQA